MRACGAALFGPDQTFPHLATSADSLMKAELQLCWHVRVTWASVPGLALQKIFFT